MRVIFVKQVHGCFASMSSLDVYLEKVVELPFVPPVGMYVQFGDWSTEVASLCFADGQLLAYTEPDKELYRNPDSRPIEEIVSEYIEMGWERRSK